MKKHLFAFAMVLTPLAFGFEQIYQCAEQWWCSQCHLSYPVSQKCCLNKNCKLFMQKKQ